VITSVVLLAFAALLLLALAIKRLAQRAFTKGLLPTRTSALLNVLAYGFGGASGNLDPLRSPEHFFHLGRFKVGATATGVRTGRLVRRTAAGTVEACGDEADDVLGVVRCRTLQASSGDRNTVYDRSADFAANDEVEVASPMPGALIELSLASGNNGTLGKKLVPAAAGEVKLYAPDVTSTVNETTVEAAIKENAAIIAKLFEDKDASAAAKAALAEWGGV
jgi:hypothetical protein